jgi:hypothetical protein
MPSTRRAAKPEVSMAPKVGTPCQVTGQAVRMRHRETDRSTAPKVLLLIFDF